MSWSARRTSTRLRSVVVPAAVLGLALSGLTAVPSRADTDHLVINEVYGRGGSAGQPYATKFVELHNPTGAAVDVSAWSLQYRSSRGTGAASGLAPLTGSVPAGGFYLISLASNGPVGDPLPTAQVTAPGLNPSGTAGTVYLSRQQTKVAPDDASVVDRVGYGTSNAAEGAPAVYEGGNSTPGSIGRTGGVDTDDNAKDFSFSATPTPGKANAAGVTTPPDPDPSPGGSVTIAQIQGTGAATPLLGTKVTTRGVVTANYPTGGFNGFYLQTPGSGGVAKQSGQASDGIFVHGSTTVTVGQCYTVTGTAAEYNGLTQLTGPTLSPATDCAPVSPTPLAALPGDDAGKEPYEGMLVQPQGEFTITNNYQLNQYGQLGLAAGGAPLWTPTEKAAPGAEAKALEAEQAKRYITLDDGSSWDYLKNTTAQGSPLPYLSQQTPMRAGSRVDFTKPVVLDYRFQWNFQPTSQVVGAKADFLTTRNDRPTAPPAVGGDVQLATFNVLNYFTDLGADEEGCKAYNDRQGNPVGTNGCQVRGAWSAKAFADQQAKIVAAINGSGAEVIGLMEVENSAAITYRPQPRDRALQQLVAALNAADTARAAGQWAYVPSPTVNAPSEDVIRTAFIYRTGTVTPEGSSQILLDQAFANARYPLAQKFTLPDGKTSFVVVANHFKSKGSGEDDGTGQGKSNPSRVAQAKALTAWTNATFAGQPVFLVGDFNAYAKEDPITAIRSAGYTELVETYAPQAATYQFDGRLGSLDHVFGNQQAAALVTGGGVWDINADESVAMQYSRRNYNVTDFFAATPFAASDHDPALIGLAGPGAETPTPTPSATPTPSVTPAPSVTPTPSSSAGPSSTPTTGGPAPGGTVPGTEPSTPPVNPGLPHTGR